MEWRTISGGLGIKTSMRRWPKTKLRKVVDCCTNPFFSSSKISYCVVEEKSEPVKRELLQARDYKVL